MSTSSTNPFFDKLRRIRLGLLLGSMSALVACGGGGGGGAGTPPATTYSIGGSVNGLAGTVVIQNNGANNLSLTANGTFSFTTQVAQGGTYAVTVLTQPAGQTCSVANGSGTAAAAVANVLISCTSVQVHVIGGSVNGLVGTVVIQNNGANNLSVAANGPFSFTTPVAQGGAYAVTVLTQPASQTCSVSNASGTATGAVTNISISCTSSSASGLAVFAGTTMGSGSTDGLGAAARFSLPQGIGTDSAGNVYVADTDNHTIRKITPTGAVTTLAGSAGVQGSADGVGSAATFRFPRGVATDTAGNVYVADSDNFVIRKITPAGAVTTLAGTVGVVGAIDGVGTAARFRLPWGVATDSTGNIYVADRNNNTIRKVTPAGSVSTLAGAALVTGSADGNGAFARFSLPQGVVTDSSGNVFVADYDNHTIRRITPAGAVTTFAGSARVPGSADGIGSATARFNFPAGLAIDSAGNLYIADSGNHTIRKVTPAGLVSTVVGVAGQANFVPGPLPGGLVEPGAVAISGNSLYFTEVIGNFVAVVQPVP